MQQNITEKNAIDNFYDFFVNTTINQNKVLDFDILYGDGSRWKNYKNECFAVYNCLKDIIEKNKLIK